MDGSERNEVDLILSKYVSSNSPIDEIELSSLFENIQTTGRVEIFLDQACTLLDSLENQLVNEVTTKSDDFWNAISALGNLTDHANSLTNAANNISLTLNTIETQYRGECKKLQDLLAQQKSLLEAEDILDKIKDFVRSQSIIQSLLDNHAFNDALRIVNEKINLFNSHLMNIAILKPIFNELLEMRVALEKMLQADLIPGPPHSS